MGDEPSDEYSDAVKTARPTAARKTRLRVIEAAAAEFSTQGYGGTTLRAIADRAGVSVETVGLAGPKRTLLRAAFDMAFAGSSDAFPASGNPAYIALAEELPFPAAATAYVRLLALSIARTATLWSALQSAADADPKAALIFQDLRAQRRREFERTAAWLAEKGMVDAAQVPALVETFFVIASHETYALLQIECSYTPEMFVARLQSQVQELLPMDD